MSFRQQLPQLTGDLFLAGAGGEAPDGGDPEEPGGQYAQILRAMPWINIPGGCCGSDFRHVTQIAKAARRRGKT